MMDWIFTVVIVLNVILLACVCAEMSKMHEEIGCVHDAEIKAHTQGWCDCLKCIDALKERKEE